jgi:hypothetical protein
MKNRKRHVDHGKIATSNICRYAYLASLPRMVFDGEWVCEVIPIMVRPYDGQHVPHAKSALG